MSREIKFRGKRTDNGEWVYGYLYGKNAIIVWDSEYTVTSLGTLITGIYQVDPETVGQFTGLLDRQGKEVFEGDVVKQFSGKEWAVCYVVEYRISEYHCGYYFKDSSLELSLDRASLSEVIGNIYENPELLKEDK